MTFPEIFVEQVMTPRSSFILVDQDSVDTAPDLAASKNFDVIPIVSKGRIDSYWSRARGRATNLTPKDRIDHRQPLQKVIKQLQRHQFQFVCYREEIVGSLDIADLNKPLARLVWLNAVLSMEQSIEQAVSNFSNDLVMNALGPNATKTAKGRRNKAKAKDLDLPIAHFAGFKELLEAAGRPELINARPRTISRLNELRNKLAHGSRRLIVTRSEVEHLTWLTQETTRLVREIADGLPQR